MLESEMAEAFMEWLKLRPLRWIRQEVPFMGRCIDVIYMDEHDVLTSVELKISKWRHAMVQASTHMIAADRSYVCMPERRVTPQLFKAFQESGIGLMLFDVKAGSVRIVVEPQGRAVPLFRRELIDRAMSIPSN